MNEAEFIKDLVSVLKKHNVTIIPDSKEKADYGTFMFDDDSNGNHEEAVLLLHKPIDGSLMD